MLTVVGISGSLRSGSYNTALLRAAIELAPEGLRVEPASIRDIPIYDGDLEQRAFPAAVTELKERVSESDGLLLVTPEYNNSVPGVLKNAIDWLSRPPGDIPKVFGDRPVGLIGASTSAGGTRLSQVAWLPVLRTLGTRPFFGKSLFVANAKNVFDAEGRLVDDKIRELLTGYLKAFTTFVEAARRS